MHSSHKNNPPTLINIVGAGRSGSTMLGAMLGRNSNAFYCGEVHAWFWPFRTHNKHLIVEAGDEIWDNIKRERPENFHAATCAHLNVDCIIDSSKSLSWAVCNNFWARRAGMRVVNLIIWKDPIDLSYSHWKRGQTAGFWKKIFKKYYGNFFSLGLPFASVHYSRLAENPTAHLQRICELSGMPYEQGMERFWETPASHVFGSLGTREQMRTGKPFVIKPRSYPDDFLPHKEEQEATLTSDQQLQYLLEQLKTNDIFAAPQLERDYVQKKPLWYYEQRLRRKFREWFPHQSTTTQ